MSRQRQRAAAHPGGDRHRPAGLQLVAIIPGADAIWFLRGGLTRWASVKGLRLQTDAQLDPVYEKMQAVWRLVAEEPKIELSSDERDPDPRTITALLRLRARLRRT